MTEKLSAFFSRAEFTCKCGCGFDTVDAETLRVLEDVRKTFGKPVVITSGCRCPDYNQRIGGAKNSLHARGRAADIVVIDVAPAEVYAFLCAEYPDKYGFGSYATFTHVDTRSGGPARWQG